MPELRKDPTHGRWVIIATERARRPGNFIRDENGVIDENKPCPFCEKNEKKTPPEIYAIRKQQSLPNTPGWKTRVIPNQTPLLRIEGNLNRHGYGMYDVLRGVGAHEIIIESPKHIGNTADLPIEQISLGIKTIRTRIHDLGQDFRFKYVLAYKNYGTAAGEGKIHHCHYQLLATPVNPLRIKEELNNAKRYYDYHERCLFCDIIQQEMSDGKRIVTQNEHFIALIPFAARFPFETWILPKKHQCDFVNAPPDNDEALADILKHVLLKLKVGLDNPSYNYVFHSAPFRREKAGEARWQTIQEDYHWHIEVMPRLTRVAGFEKGTGFYICVIPPEAAAEFLRKVEV